MSEVAICIALEIDISIIPQTNPGKTQDVVGELIVGLRFTVKIERVREIGLKLQLLLHKQTDVQDTTERERERENFKKFSSLSVLPNTYRRISASFFYLSCLSNFIA